MTLKQMAEALRTALVWLEWEHDTLEEFHKYGRIFGGTPGSNVFTFVLEDALRHRGMTLEQFRAKT